MIWSVHFRVQRSYFMRDYSVSVDKYPFIVPEMEVHLIFRMYGIPVGFTKFIFIYEYQFYGELINNRKNKGQTV